MLRNPDDHVSWVNVAAEKRHAALIINRGVEVARLWDHTAEQALQRAEKLRSLQGWVNAKVVMHEA